MDTGPLWFVGVLLVFSLGHAGWDAARSPVRDTAGRRGGRRAVTARTLALTAPVVAPPPSPSASSTLRLRGRVTDLDVRERPACLAVFAPGLAVALRPLALTAEVKATVVAAGALAWLLRSGLAARHPRPGRVPRPLSRMPGAHVRRTRAPSAVGGG